MNNFFQKLKVFSPVILRVGLAFVFIWFGVNQIMEPQSWIDFVPEYITSFLHLDVTTVVYLNAAFEILCGSALLLGFSTRVVALLLALHMLDITFTVGLDDSIGVRDLGLSCAMIAIWLNGYDWLSLDRWIKSENKVEEPAL
jgi:uncharacterized membrane protein YphA (DoxX/SURF4 family)